MYDSINKMFTLIEILVRMVVPYIRSAVKCLLFEGIETGAKTFTARCKEGTNTDGRDLVVEAAVDVQCLDCRCALPDVTEGNAGKVAAPADGMRDATQCCQDQVAQHFAQVEALVGELPHTVQGMGVVRLSQNLFKRHLL